MEALAGLLPPAASAGTSVSAAASAPGAAAHEDAGGRTPRTSPWSHGAEEQTLVKGQVDVFLTQILDDCVDYGLEIVSVYDSPHPDYGPGVS